MSLPKQSQPAPQWDLAEAKRIVTHMLAPHKTKIYLFGSRANGTMRRDSDIDIAILPEDRLPTGLLSDIREALEQSNILYTVELVDLSLVSSEFRNRVIIEGSLWTD
jgi:predicted nucleotidyltransferase